MILVYIVWKYIVLNLYYIIQDIVSTLNKVSVIIVIFNGVNYFQNHCLFCDTMKKLGLLWILQEMVGYQRDTTELIQRRKMLRKAILYKQSFHPIGRVKMAWSISLPTALPSSSANLPWSMRVIWHLANPTAGQGWGILLWHKRGACSPWEENCWPLRTPTIEIGLALSLLYVSKALLSPVLDCVLFYLATPIPRRNG